MSLDLSSCPPIYILPTHLQTDELHDAEDVIFQAGGHLTYLPKEAKVFLGRVSQKKRAAFELRGKGVWTAEVEDDFEVSSDGPPYHPPPTASASESYVTARKRLKVSDNDNDNENETVGLKGHPNLWPDLEAHILVLKLDWLRACQTQNQVVPHHPYLVYKGKAIPQPADEVTSPRSRPGTITYIKATPESGNQPRPASMHSRRPFQFSSSPAPHHRSPPKLHRTTTSEHDSLAQHSHPPSGVADPSTLLTSSSDSVPPPPQWVKDHLLYSCLRSTPADPPNAAFIAQLSKIKLGRLLTLDSIGVRAYSTSIASIAAYPFVLSSEAEVVRLPGCDAKIASLWSEWFMSADEDSHRTLEVVRQLDADPDLKVLKLFWNIWGVGPDTARRFYFEQGWKDLDDVVEFGWSTLSRAQQIGVKFYDEFQLGIPRDEVERIAAAVKQHARACMDIGPDDWDTVNDIELIIVGGYRRGKEANGDVDVIVSHRDEAVTKDLIVHIVRALEEAGLVSHTLALQTTTSDRGQQTLPFRGVGHGGHGFDSLDKALCVWQEPPPSPPASPPTANDEKESEYFSADENETSSPKPNTEATPPPNPNPHRRVDIIVSAWRTVGCAVLGWSGGTTFQRDIRRFVSKERGWKFDSSGVRNRGNGLVLDLESPRPGDEGDTWLDRERRLMVGLGIGWRDAPERCTG